MGGEVSHPWWIFLWQWLDVPSSSALLISHNKYSYMLYIQPFFSRVLLPHTSSENLPSCHSCSSCLSTPKGTSLPSPSSLPRWAFAVSPVKLQVYNQSCRGELWPSELGSTAMTLYPHEAFDAMPWSLPPFIFLFPLPPLSIYCLVTCKRRPGVLFLRLPVYPHRQEGSRGSWPLLLGLGPPLRSWNTTCTPPSCLGICLWHFLQKSLNSARLRGGRCQRERRNPLDDEEEQRIKWKFWGRKWEVGLRVAEWAGWEACSMDAILTPYCSTLPTCAETSTPSWGYRLTRVC